MQQNSPGHMEATRLRKTLSAAQKKLDISKKLIDDLRQDPSSEHAEPFPGVDKDFGNPFPMTFLNDLQANISKPGPARRFSEETYAACLIIRTFSTRAYEFIRHSLIPLPQLKHVDEDFKPAIDLIQN
jgi:hypothetical protein